MRTTRDRVTFHIVEFEGDCRSLHHNLMGEETNVKVVPLVHQIIQNCMLLLRTKTANVVADQLARMGSSHTP